MPNDSTGKPFPPASAFGPNAKDDPPKQIVSAEEILAQVAKQTVSAPPPSLPSAPQSEPSKPAGGAFRSGDGRILFRYEIDGETFIFSKPIEQMQEEDFYRDIDLNSTAILSNRLPQMLSVKFKDPQWAGQWFNRKAGDGRRVSYAKTLGFVPAKIEDCEFISHGLTDTDGAIIDNDLVLMKIHKGKLAKRWLESAQEARIKGGISHYKSVAEGFVHGAGNKISHYHTPQAEKEYQGLGEVTHLNTVS